MRILYKISAPGQADRFVNPYNGKDAKLSWNREDERRYDFKKELKELTLVGEDYRFFAALETSENRCNLQSLTVILDCNGYEADYFTLFKGTFSMSSGKWDLDRCTVKFEIDPLDPYTPLEDNDEDHNILEYTILQQPFGQPQTVNLGLTIGIEAYACFSNGGTPLCNQTTLDNGLWGFYKQRNFGFGVVFKVYTRQYLICPCDYTPSSDWTLLEACEDDEMKYIRYYVPGDTELVDLSDDLDLSNLSTPISSIDNGRKLKDVMQELLRRASGLVVGPSVVSDFFQWNPQNPTQTNYVTGELNKFSNLIIFQKSDVKRPNTSNNATVGEISFFDLLEQLCEIFNLGYKMIGDTFRIEHISWFETDLGINLLSIDNKKLLNGTRQYSYDKTKLPKYEKFEFMESGSADFVGTNIVYDSNCVNNDEENRSETKIDRITTDVIYCLQNPDPDSDVADDGFVIMACDENNNLLSEPGILENNNVVNNVLSWAHLHRDYWKHGRVLPQGIMNNEATDFLSVKPTIKQDQFSAIMDCEDLKVFNPLDKLNGSLGWGFLESAELQLSKCAMTIDLILEKIEPETFEEILGDFDSDFSDEFD